MSALDTARTAVHEGSHAVAVILCGAELLDASITPDGLSGAVNYRQHVDPYINAVIAQAGSAGERIHFRTATPALDDLTAAEEYLVDSHQTAEVAGMEASLLLSEYPARRAVERVADALITNRTLIGDEVREIADIKPLSPLTLERMQHDVTKP